MPATDAVVASIPTPKVKPRDIPAAQPSTPYQEWAADFRQRLLEQKAFSAGFLDAQLADLRLIERAIELDRRQPERTLTHGQYLERVVSETRKRQGIDRFARYRDALAAVEAEYGVPAEIITALWGIETS
ncbi:MAG: lytic murein transglycosylase, partial [Pseudomonadota bacterium]